MQSGTRKKVSETEYLCSFQCPVIGPWTVATDISLQSDPAPTLSPGPATQVPFYTARNNKIYIATILMSDSQRIKSFLMFIPSATLTSHIDNLPSEAQRQIIGWDDWGPTGTRLLQFPSPGSSRTWVCYVYGMRFVAPINNGGAQSTMLRVFDFDPLSLKRAVLAGGDDIEDGDIHYAIEPTLLNTEGAFENLILTSLPYRVRKVALPGSEDNEQWQDRFDAVMLSEDNLILVGVCLFLPMFCDP